MRTAIRTLLLMATLAQCAFVTDDTYAIKRTPMVGAVAKFIMTGDFQVNGGQGQIIATVSEKVTAVDKDGNFTVEQSQIEASGTFEKEKIETPSRNPISLTYKPNGQVTSIKGDLIDANSYRMENLGALVDPGKQVAINDVWTSESKADKDLGTVAVKAIYKLIGEEKIGNVDTLKIQATVKETEGDKPAENEFTEWISKTDGSMIQLQAKWTNAPFPDISYPVTATIKLSRVAS